MGKASAGTRVSTGGETELESDPQEAQGQPWKVQLAGGQRCISRSPLTSQGSPAPQFPMPETVDRLVPLMTLSSPL